MLLNIKRRYPSPLVTPMLKVTNEATQLPSNPSLNSPMLPTSTPQKYGSILGIVTFPDTNTANSKSAVATCGFFRLFFIQHVVLYVLTPFAGPQPAPVQSSSSEHAFMHSSMDGVLVLVRSVASAALPP
jgi:hypothetical protein